MDWYPNRKAVLVAAACLFALAAPAMAADSDWYLIYATGKKPERHVYLAKEVSVSPPPAQLMAEMTKGRKGNVEALQANYKGIDLVEVFEGKGGPDSVSRTLEFMCDTKMFKQKWSFTIFRDDRNEQGGEQDWVLIESPWQERAKTFACTPARGRTEANQMASLGPLSSVELTDLAWGSFWKDGTRPPYTTKRSKEEVEAQTDAQMAQLQQMRDALPGMARKLKDDYERAGRETQKNTEDFRRRSRTPNSRLESWIGASEQQLVASWGTPPWFRQDGGARLLSYRYGYRSELRTHGGQGALMSATDYYCDITFDVREGVVWSYYLGGEMQQCAELKVDMGPNPGNAVVH